jgi:prepilin peptidase CpaA
MLYLTLYLFGVLVALGAGAASAVSDFKGMRIPNALSLIVIAAFGLSYTVAVLAGVDMLPPLKNCLLAGLVTFIVTFIMFCMKALGGGDSKLASAYALWVGMSGLPLFLFVMALTGAALGALALFVKRKKPFKKPPPESWVARLQAGESAVPYGIAIFAGALSAFFSLGYMTLENLSMFLM